MHTLVPGDEIADVLDPYLRVDRTTADGSCWVMANMVGGLDGTAAWRGRVGPLSGSTDARLFRRLRSLADVVLVGAETVRRERYGPVRLPDDLRRAREAAGRSPVPPLAIVSGSLHLDWEAPVFTDADPAARTLVVTAAAADPARLEEANAHAEVVIAGIDRVELPDALALLAGRDCRVVLCEGGPRLLGEVVEAGLLDEMCLTVAPLMGGDPLPIAITGDTGTTEFRLAHVAADDGTLFTRYERAPDPPGRDAPDAPDDSESDVPGDDAEEAAAGGA
jgi:riboflavin biosynthesis pyrimidine reductase